MGRRKSTAEIVSAAKTKANFPLPSLEQDNHAHQSTDIFPSVYASEKTFFEKGRSEGNASTAWDSIFPNGERPSRQWDATFPNGTEVSHKWDSHFPSGEMLSQRWDATFPRGERLSQWWDAFFPSGETLSRHWDSPFPNGETLSRHWDATFPNGETLSHKWDSYFPNCEGVPIGFLAARHKGSAHNAPSFLRWFLGLPWKWRGGLE